MKSEITVDFTAAEGTPLLKHLRVLNALLTCTCATMNDAADAAIEANEPAQIKTAAGLLLCERGLRRMMEDIETGLHAARLCTEDTSLMLFVGAHEASDEELAQAARDAGRSVGLSPIAVFGGASREE